MRMHVNSMPVGDTIAKCAQGSGQESGIPFPGRVLALSGEGERVFGNVRRKSFSLMQALFAEGGTLGREGAPGKPLWPGAGIFGKAIPEGRKVCEGRVRSGCSMKQVPRAMLRPDAFRETRGKARLEGRVSP
jgi:hypothetical protein